MDFLHPQQSMLLQEILEFMGDEGSDFNLLIFSYIYGCHLFKLGISSQGEIRVSFLILAIQNYGFRIQHSPCNKFQALQFLLTKHVIGGK